jgi:hypothetical protein
VVFSRFGGFSLEEWGSLGFFLGRLRRLGAGVRVRLLWVLDADSGIRLKFAGRLEIMVLGPTFRVFRVWA